MTCIDKITLKQSDEEKWLVLQNNTKQKSISLIMWSAKFCFSCI